MQSKKTPPTPKRIPPSIRHDSINPQDYAKYILPWACEDCSHYDSVSTLCSFGYPTHWHRREYQRESYERGGKVAVCRVQEID